MSELSFFLIVVSISVVTISLVAKKIPPPIAVGHFLGLGKRNF